jgi:beta-galactosidase
VPFLETEWPLAPDRSVAGGRLRARGAIHDKGLGMHSTARAAYDLNGRYRRFAAQLAIDDAAGLGGSVTFRVFLDDAAGGWKQAYESPVIRGGAPPVPLSLDVTSARRLALIVDFADRGDTLDHADWLDARLVRK